MKFDLDQNDMQMLGLALGIATGTAMKQDMPQLAKAILELTKKINANNPTLANYDPAQSQSRSGT